MKTFKERHNYSIFLLLLIIISTFAAEKFNIAVMELDGHGVTKTDLGGLSNRLRTELFKTGKFNVFERSRVDEILREQGFQQTGCTNATCAVEVGQIIGVEKIVVGNVDKVGQIYSIDVRMVDVKTGKIEEVATKECESCTIGDILKITISDVAKIVSGATPDEPKEPALDEKRKAKERRPKKQKAKKKERDKSLDTASIGKAYFLIDPLGFVVFGPTLEAGVRIARNTTLGLNVRFLKLGYVSSLVISDATKLGSISPGLRIDHFFGRKTSRSKFYVGIGSQLQLIFYEYPGSQETEGNSGAIIIMADFGHRWRSRKGLFLNLGLYFGIGFEVWDKYWYKDNPSDVQRDDDLDKMPGGGIELSFGKEF